MLMRLLIRIIKVFLLAATVISNIAMLYWMTLFYFFNATENIWIILFGVISIMAILLTSAIMIYRWFLFERVFIFSPLVTALVFGANLMMSLYRYGF
jgi:hypothetical protein